MPAAASSCLCFRAFLTLLHTPRRIDRGKLTLERSAVLLRKLFDTPDGPECSDRSAEQRDAGEKEERFPFGGCWHAPTIGLCARLSPTKFSRRVSNRASSDPNESRARPRRRQRPEDSAPTPCRRCPAWCDGYCLAPARTRSFHRSNSRSHQRRSRASRA